MGDIESNSGASQASVQASEEQRTALAYEEQFTAFIDFLGFSEVSRETEYYGRSSWVSTATEFAEPI